MERDSRSLNDLMEMENEEVVDESDSTSENAAPVEMEVRGTDVSRYYSDRDVPDIRDIVIHVRSKYPNPWQRVIIDTDLSVPVKDLEDMMIYVKGVNEDKVREVRGLGSYCYCPVRVSSEFVGQGDYGLRAKLAEYSTTYNVNSYEILIYGEDTEALQGVWDYIQNHGDIQHGVYFPVSFTNSLKLFSNGLDVAPYARRLMDASTRNAITSEFLKGIMDELRNEVRNGKIAIQDFEETRSIYAKWLTMCLVQEFSLPPVYLSSYISEYINMKIAYPFEKLSFFERVQFIRNLPQTVGYVGLNQEFKCLYTIQKKVYPNPAIAFDMQSGEVLTEDLDERFALENLEIFDYRGMFTQSRDYFVEQQTGLAAAGTADSDTDKKLVSLFNEMTEAAAMPDVFMSIRNTVLAKLNGRTYIVYYTEPFGVWGFLQSEYFGAHPYAVYEEEFHRLIDVKVILAEREKQNTVASSEGNSKFQQIMLRASTTFKPAIPTFLLMCSELSRYLATDMSYYDKRLRCDRNVIPIITHSDSQLCDKKSVFNYIDLLNLRRDPMAKDVVSAFGTLNSDAGSAFLSKIPVSTDTFRGCSLL